ncbi:MAG: anaerobic ribonucleoside-triphosphate reductase activating protein [Elusimicrobiota bacterium]|nr:anaerobic ribonucleoside-triphosphate reductase activating protein [Elusimicrobiota bacterium]
MTIGGLLKFSMIDFPGSISAIVFTQGCNLRCGYCHNPELIAQRPQTAGEPDWEEADVLYYLEKRRGALDGLVITGGEPSIQPDLKDFIVKVKAMGYLVKLDTNGTSPSVLKDLLDNKLLDFVAMDIKAPFEKYAAICGVPVDMEKIKASINLLQNSGLPYELRTTYDKTVLTEADIAALKAQFPALKVQKCNPVKPKDTLKVSK